MEVETISLLIATLLAVGFIGYIGYGFFLILSGTLKSARDQLLLHYQDSVNGSLKDHYGKYLANQFSYYDKLPEKQKVKFLIRLRNFISEKTFIGRDQLEITEEKKILVAASAIQLTYGLDNYSLSHFDKIILYPSSFYNRKNDAWHMGETNMGGVIVLSWQDLQEGFHKKDDTYNVGLHEMAHALELQFLFKDDYDFFFGNYFAKWSHLAESEFQNLQDERESFFRKYAGVNRREFFAVSIEYFFEASEQFKARLPQMYYHLCILLKQDPLHRDASVKEATRKTQAELKMETTTLAPLLATDISVAAVLKNYVFLFIIFLSLTFEGFTSTPFMLYLSLAAGALIAIQLFRQMNRIILYENYLAVTSVFGHTKWIYELDEVVLFEFSEQASSLRTVLAKNGKIIIRNHEYYIDEETIGILKKKLHEKNVLVR